MTAHVDYAAAIATSSTTYYYGYGIDYALGQVTSAYSVNAKNGYESQAADTSTGTEYVWWDGAVQSKITHDGDTGSGSNPIYYTNFSYDAQGRLTNATVGDYLYRYVGLTKSKNNADTFKPYNPAEAIGDLSPTTPQPPKKAKCGVLGMILLAVIAVAVTVVTAGAALSAAGLVSGGVFGAVGGVATVLGGGLIGAAGVAGGLAIGAGAAMVGSIVSQGVGVATGIQEKFSWKGVAMAGIGSLVSAGIGQIAGGGGWPATGARAAASSAITQGIGVATGLQKKFDWAGIAAAGVGAAVGHLAGDLFKAESIIDNNSFGNYAANFGKGAASAIANAATRSTLTGESFGDSFKAAIPDVVAQTLTDIMFHGIKGGGKAATTASSAGGGEVAGGAAASGQAAAQAPVQKPADQVAAQPATTQGLDNTTAEAAEAAVTHEYAAADIGGSSAATTADRPQAGRGGGQVGGPENDQDIPEDEEYGVFEDFTEDGQPAEEMQLATATFRKAIPAPAALRARVTTYILQEGKNADVAEIDKILDP